MPIKPIVKTDSKAIDKKPAASEGAPAVPEVEKALAQARVDQPGEPTTDKGPGKRLFQRGDGARVWLDEAEATAAGFYWKPDPDAKKKK